jgi:hypothetical protein
VCETIHLKHDSTFSEDTELDGSSIVTTNYYPPSTSRRTPTWLGSKNSPFWYGDTVIEQWLKEIYSAVQNDSRRLAVMGIRSLLETVMIEKVGETRCASKHHGVADRNRLCESPSSENAERDSPAEEEVIGPRRARACSRSWGCPKYRPMFELIQRRRCFVWHTIPVVFPLSRFRAMVGGYARAHPPPID